MATWTTIARDLARTAMIAAGRAMQSSRTAGSTDIDMPELATVDDVRAARDARDDAAPGTATPPDAGNDPERDRRRRDRDDDGVASPGQLGPAATIEVEPGDLDLVRTEWNPDTDGDPDPGEIVWTWVPYEEADGRGKDRPVVVVARLASDAVLAVQLSSRDHDDDRGWVGIGAGDWDGAHRESWVDLERLLLVRPAGMRREAATLEPRALRSRRRGPGAAVPMVAPGVVPRTRVRHGRSGRARRPERPGLTSTSWGG